MLDYETSSLRLGKRFRETKNIYKLFLKNEYNALFIVNGKNLGNKKYQTTQFSKTPTKY